MAVGLCMGGNAWADATTVYEKGTTGHAWTDDDVATWTGTTGDGYSVTRNENGLVFALDFGSTTGRYAYEYSHSITTTDDYKVTFNAVWSAGSPTGKVNANNSYLAIGDVKIRLYGQNSKLTIQFGSDPAEDVMVGSTDGNNSTLRSKDFNIEITINKKTKAVAYSISTSAWNSGTPVTGTGVVSDASVSTIKIGYDRGGQQLNSFSQTLKSVVITEEEDATPTANYTVNYVDGEGNELKASSIRSGEVDATATILESDKDAIWKEGVKYLYSSDNASSTTIANDNSSVVTVTFTEAASYTYTVDDNLSNNLASGSVYAGEKFYFGVPYYVFKAGKFYNTPSLSSGTLSYGAGTSPVINSNTEITVTYTEEASTNVVFYSEAENLAGITVQDDGFIQSRMSNRKAGYYASSTAFVTLPAGVYTLASSTRSGTTRFYAGEVGSGREIMTLSSTGSVVTTTSDPFILAEETKIYTSVGSSSAYFDYVIIRKTGDLPATENIVVTSAGFATYVSNYNLDFTSATTKAYKVNVASQGVATLTQVDEVPAKTPVLLYAAGGNGEGEAIPVTTEAVSAVSGNNLVAGTGAAVATDDGEYTNMILWWDKDNPSVNPIGFYFANGQTVAANRAYLHIADDMAPAAEARMVMIFADDETTGISDASRLMDNGKIRNDNFFNLNGQRVEKPAKGLYIVNGKKVVMK